MHPRREQICNIPPPLTIMGTIGALHLVQFEAAFSSAWQCGQKKFATLSFGRLCLSSIL